MPVETEKSGIDEELRALAVRPDVQTAVSYLREHDEETLASQIELTEIPAPPFHETRRGERMAALMEAAGLNEVETDETGNVVAHRPGTSMEPPLVLAAHLDTVFPPETDVGVTRSGSLLHGPGISDDGRGLAALLALARALDEAGLGTRAPLLFVATVGEEGIGDLRGVKGLFAEGSPVAEMKPAGFISLDGAGLERIVARGLGSRRFRVTLRGPGGHSWTDWGTANPVHALMEAGARLSRLELADDPRTTLTIARVGGGKSINAIPQEAWMEMDLRSGDSDALEELVVRVRDAVDDCMAGQEDLECEIETIGDRPGGATDPSSRLVQAALAATRLLGSEPKLALSSTDANVPMRQGIPAITVGCGGEAGKAHTTEEWYRNTGGPDGIVRALYMVLLVAGVAGD